MRILFGLFVFLMSTPVLAADPVFKYDPDRARAGVIYHYQKSNMDGTHASFVSVYRPTSEWIASLKSDRSGGGATLVEAQIDWTTFTVSRFEVRDLRPEVPESLRTVVDIEADGTFTGSSNDGSELSGRIEPPNWHSYDFDFASLSAVFPHLTDPEAAFSIAVGDPNPGPRLSVKIIYVGVDTYGGFKSRKYTIDGPGLENRGGYLWTDFEHGHLVGFEIDLPDERGFVSNKVMLLEVEEISPERWACLRSNRGNSDSC